MPQMMQRELPPLILHPFASQSGSSDVIESSRAAMMLADVFPREKHEDEALFLRLIRGRWEEIQMLFFIGKDLHRWLDQCVEIVERDPDMADKGYGPGFFAMLLVSNTPPEVASKLRGWGVTDYKAIFRRALGLAAAFSRPPAPDSLNPSFMRLYHRYADGLFKTYLTLNPAAELPASQFTFRLYSSGEYARLLEQEWSG